MRVSIPTFKHILLADVHPGGISPVINESWEPIFNITYTPLKYYHHACSVFVSAEISI